MTPTPAERGYRERAAEYAGRFGRASAAHARDRDRIADWGDGVTGAVLDAGCGPGHWTAFLRERGVAATGLDLVPALVAEARHRFPGAPYRVGNLLDLDDAQQSLGGVLAWYSLIHLEPAELETALAEFARVLVPGGSLLLGCFDGPHAEPFEHAIAPARFWSVAGLSALLRAAGFTVTAIEQRHDPGARPHAALSAVRGPEPGATPAR